MTTTPFYTGRSVYTVTYGKELCRALGFNFTPAVDRFFRAWAQSEACPAAHNPFATTARMAGSTSFNYVGVQHYVSWQQGVEATKKTLLNGKYGPLVAAIKAGTSAVAMATALKNSPWGTGDLTLRVLSTGGPRLFPIGTCYLGHPAWTRTIKPGMSGRDVDEVLRHLGNTATFYSDAQDEFDPVAAVVKHQRLRPWLWPADGVIGPKTYRSITKHA